MLCVVLVSLALVLVSVASLPTNSTQPLAARNLQINYGQSSNADVVWANGDSACNGVELSPNGLNPCSRPFSLHGTSGFTLEGCGDGLWVNLNGQFYESCVTQPASGDCGIEEEWTCL